MKKELKKAGAVIAAGVMLLSQTQMFSIGAKADETAEPITIQFWHTRGSGANYEVVQHEVEEFNNTIGKEKGITVEETFIGNYNDILAKTQLAGCRIRKHLCKLSSGGRRAGRYGSAGRGDRLGQK